MTLLRRLLPLLWLALGALLANASSLDAMMVKRRTHDQHARLVHARQNDDSTPEDPPASSGDLGQPAAEPLPKFTNAQLLNPMTYASANFKQGDIVPGTRVGDAPGQTVQLHNPTDSVDGNSPTQHCAVTVFTGRAAITGSPITGWGPLPQVVGFDIKRDIVIQDSAVQPYWIESYKDLSKIKRVIWGSPGASRDTWKYVQMLRNSLICAAYYDPSIDLSEILVAGAMWYSEDDHNAGNTGANDLYYKAWSQGSMSSGPGRTRVTPFRVLDTFFTQFFEKMPQLTSIVMAGHSLGASFTNRYSVLRKAQANEDNIIYWVGNPGAYLWPVAQRPVMNNGTCPTIYDMYPYGLNATQTGDPELTPYSRSDFDRDATLQRYYARKIHYNLGLADGELGDSHCEAQYQGPTHLTRGVNLEKVYNNLPANNHSFHFVPNVGHNDFAMFADPTAQQVMFKDEMNLRRPAPASSTTSNTTTTNSSSSSSAAAGGSSSSSSPASSSGSSGNSTRTSSASRIEGLGTATAAGLLAALFQHLL